MKWYRYPHFTDDDTKGQESFDNLYQSQICSLIAEPARVKAML